MMKSFPNVNSSIVLSWLKMNGEMNIVKKTTDMSIVLVHTMIVDVKVL